MFEGLEFEHLEESLISLSSVFFEVSYFECSLEVLGSFCEDDYLRGWLFARMVICVDDICDVILWTS